MLISPQPYRQTPHKMETLFYRASGIRDFYKKTFVFYFDKIEDLCKMALACRKSPHQESEYEILSLNEKFEEDMHAAYDYRATWLDCVLGYLKDEPNYVEKLNNALRFSYSRTSMDLPQIEEKLNYIKTHDDKLYDEVIKYLDDYDRFAAEIDIYRDILEERREANWHRVSELGTRRKNNETSVEPRKTTINSSNSLDGVAYGLHFEEFQSELWINEYKIRRCNVRSDFGDAIMRALKSPDKTTKVPENMAQNISSLKIPPELRHMMFRVGGGQMKISPIITYAQIKDAGLDYQVLNRQFREMLSKIS